MSIEMPVTPGFTNCRFFIETNSQVFESPLTKTTQRMILGGSRWNATYSLPAMKQDKASLWQAFFMLLEGRANSFNAYDPDRKAARGVATGTPLVNGASQTGSSLTIDGCTHSVTGWLLPGDFFNVNGELKMATSQVNTNSSGQATINFKPALRSSPADNAPIITTRPYCTMILADDMQAAFDCNVTGVYQPKTFTATEVFS
jgi:hypothetical protein